MIAFNKTEVGLESLIFPKTLSEEIKKENLPVADKISSFHEILHHSMNEASNSSYESLQSYGSISKEIIDQREIKQESNDQFKVEIFNERFSKENKMESFAKSNDSRVEENTSNLPTVDRAVVQENRTEIENGFLEEEEELESEKITRQENSDESKTSKGLSANILGQILLNIDSTNEKENNKKNTSNSEKNEIKSQISPIPVKTSKEEQVSVKQKSESISGKELPSKEIKKNETKVVLTEAVVKKESDTRPDVDSKNLFIRELTKDSQKINTAEIKADENTKVSQNSPKSKEVIQNQNKNNSQSKTEVNLVELTNKTITVIKEEAVTHDFSFNELRKSKKNSDSNSKEKSGIEAVKPIFKDVSQTEKELKVSKETLVEVAKLDKNKWTITRREKDVEISNLERKKESANLLSEIAAKSNSSQTSSESDKSFGNPRYDANSLKSFADLVKGNNVDKPKEAMFDKANFSRSLNDLVSKARINIVENGRNTAQISLYPKDLGKMTLNIDVIQEKVEGKILVDSEFIKNRLLGDVSQLKADLKANGLDLQSISIEVRSESSMGFEFANPSNDKDSEKKAADNMNSTSKLVPKEEIVEIDSLNKSYNLVDIKI